MYSPAEDSEMIARVLASVLAEEHPQSYCDMGTGTGFLSESALRHGLPKEAITAVDIDGEAVAEAAKLGVKAICSDLFQNINESFDLISFNPPYLPEDEHEKGIDTSGGREGWETIERFLSQAGMHLNEEGKILLLFSSLTGKKKVGEIAKAHGFSFKEAECKKFFMEELFVWIVSRE